MDENGFPLLEITIIKVGSITKVGKQYHLVKETSPSKKKGRLKIGNKGNNKITEFRTIFQRKVKTHNYINRQNQSTTGKL